MLNSDATIYGGSGQGNMGGVDAVPIPLHGRQVVGDAHAAAARRGVPDLGRVAEAAWTGRATRSTSRTPRPWRRSHVEVARVMPDTRPDAPHRPAGRRSAGGQRGIRDRVESRSARMCSTANRCEFRVWAPNRATSSCTSLRRTSAGSPMTKDVDGYHEAVVGLRRGDALPVRRRRRAIVPIPPRACSRKACTGRRKSSGAISNGTTRAGRGIALEDYVVYELHVGTFTEKERSTRSSRISMR